MQTEQLVELAIAALEDMKAQDILARNYNRVRDAKVAEKYKAQFPAVRLYTVELFGGWNNIQKVHFAEGGILDQVFEKR